MARDTRLKRNGFFFTETPWGELRMMEATCKMMGEEGRGGGL